MTCMLEGTYDKGIVDAIPADTVLMSGAVVKVGSNFS